MPINQRQSKFRRSRENDITFDPGDFKPVTPYTEDIKDEYQEAQQALLELRQREEFIRKKAEQLEEISQKEEDFTGSRDELIHQIEGYLDLLDHEASESDRISEQCISAHQRLLHHLHTIEKLRPETADRQNLNRELDLALRHIEAAEHDVHNALPLIEHISGHRKGPAPVKKDQIINEPMPQDFGFWLKAGFAFTLPLMMLIVGLAIALFFLN